MEVLDKFINFILEHRRDERIDIKKRMKYGYRHYSIYLAIDDEPKKDQSGLLRNRFVDNLEILIDNRNVCIEIIFDNGDKNIIIEDKELVEKWSKIIDEILNDDLELQLKNVFENSLNACHNKNLFREYQMRKIIPN